MEIFCTKNFDACGAAAAKEGIARLKKILSEQDEANIILATGMSQFSMLSLLRAADGIAWERINAFHLDEYVGLPIRHPASFRAVLWKEFAATLPVPLKSFAWIDGENDPKREASRLDRIIADHPIDIAFIGIGENGHLAFNDPPADFATDKPYLVVTLDEACRRQQAGEGWFKTVEDVPARAITMSVRQILKSKTLIVTCPDERKSAAVRDSLEQPINNRCPGSILRAHPDAKLYLDAGSASKITGGMAPGDRRNVPVEPMP